MNYLTINNTKFNTLNIASVNTPYTKAKKQQQLGVTTIANTVKAHQFMISNKDLSCIIHYGMPTNYMYDILNRAYYKNKAVFIRLEDKFITYKPTKPESEYTKFNIKNSINTYTDERTGRRRLTDKEKSELTNLIKYYELDYPQSDIEWVLIKEQLDFYTKNNIDYAFDKSQKYICPECGELASYTTEHICYDYTEAEKTKLDYIVNGGE